MLLAPTFTFDYNRFTYESAMQKNCPKIRLRTNGW
jgi:hypothetical protein